MVENIANHLIPEPQAVGAPSIVVTEISQEWPTVEDDDVVARDDTKLPLREIIADEELEDSAEVFAMTLNREEYEAKLVESKNNATMELLESIQIMNTSPVSDDISRRPSPVMSSSTPDVVVLDSEEDQSSSVAEANGAKTGTTSTSTAIGDTINIENLDERMIARLVDQVIVELQTKLSRAGAVSMLKRRMDRKNKNPNL
ncbi:hypothetical protein G9A89_000555 [Geosiphon pyriformis]|nr:hypothetical protein G9A89_000555 [Geosiphon pyriformis]